MMHLPIRSSSGGIWRFLARETCGFGVVWQKTIGFAIDIIIIFGFMYFIGYWREGLKEALFKQKLNSNSKLVKISQIILESIAFSAIVLLSLPKEFYPYGEKKYSKFIGHRLIIIPFRLLIIIERLIGWGLMILLISTVSRVMIHY